MNFLLPITDDTTEENKKNLEELNRHLQEKKPTFLFIYMDGCGPCDSTKEQWEHIKDYVEEDVKKADVIVAQVNKNLFNKLDNVGPEPSGFPTLRYIDNGNIEEYESGRSSHALAGWITGKMGANRLSMQQHTPVVKSSQPIETPTAPILDDYDPPRKEVHVLEGVSQNNDSVAHGIMSHRKPLPSHNRKKTRATARKHSRTMARRGRKSRSNKKKQKVTLKLSRNRKKRTTNPKLLSKKRKKIVKRKRPKSVYRKR